MATGPLLSARAPTSSTATPRDRSATYLVKSHVSLRASQTKLTSSTLAFTDLPESPEPQLGCSTFANQATEVLKVAPVTIAASEIQTDNSPGECASESVRSLLPNTQPSSSMTQTEAASLSVIDSSQHQTGPTESGEADVLRTAVADSGNSHHSCYSDGQQELHVNDEAAAAAAEQKSSCLQAGGRVSSNGNPSEKNDGRCESDSGKVYDDLSAAVAAAAINIKGSLFPKGLRQGLSQSPSHDLSSTSTRYYGDSRRSSLMTTSDGMPLMNGCGCEGRYGTSNSGDSSSAYDTNSSDGLGGVGNFRRHTDARGDGGSFSCVNHSSAEDLLEQPATSRLECQDNRSQEGPADRVGVEWDYFAIPNDEGESIRVPSSGGTGRGFGTSLGVVAAAVNKAIKHDDSIACWSDCFSTSAQSDDGMTDCQTRNGPTAAHRKQRIRHKDHIALRCTPSPMKCELLGRGDVWPSSVGDTEGCPARSRSYQVLERTTKAARRSRRSLGRFASCSTAFFMSHWPPPVSVSSVICSRCCIPCSTFCFSENEQSALRRLETVACIPYDQSNPSHEMLLARYWILALPGIPCNLKPDPQWVTGLGFQGNDPRTDFRGGGYLSLKCMLFLARTRQADFCLIREESQTFNSYPFSAGFINVSFMLVVYFGLNPSARYCSSGHKGRASKTTLKAFARLLSNPNNHAFEELFCCSCIALHQAWRRQSKRSGATLMNFRHALLATKIRIIEVLRARPKNVAAFENIFKE